MDRQFRLARVRSNDALRKLGPLFTGDVVHVSGWRDEDKEGGRYRDYFPNAATYALTNYTGYRGYQGSPGELQLDLTAELPADLAGRFDVAFNHTTLEHIFDVRTAFENLCALSRDVVIVVVPFAQVEHRGETFGDYWRFTPDAVAEMCRHAGMTPVHQSANNDRNSAVYVITVASRHPERWTDRLPPGETEFPLAGWLGVDAWTSLKTRARRVLRRS